VSVTGKEIVNVPRSSFYLSAVTIDGMLLASNIFHIPSAYLPAQVLGMAAADSLEQRMPLMLRKKRSIEGGYTHDTALFLFMLAIAM